MLRGLVHACPPNSLTKVHGAVYEDPKLIKTKSFISNPMSTFDLCNHPTYFPIHGVTAEKLPHMDGELKALFSLSKTLLHTDILGIPTEQFEDNMFNIPWDERTQDSLLWRGSNTGTYASGETNWRLTQRMRLIKETSPKAVGGIELLPVPNTKAEGTIEKESLMVKRATLNALTMDIVFAGTPIRKHPGPEVIYRCLWVFTNRLTCASTTLRRAECNEEDGTCEALRQEYEFSDRSMTHEEALQFKYILDV